MANALRSDATNLQANAIHQFLHGYSEGHKLLQNSLKLPNDLARLMLRMSDLSGSSVVGGFEQYITGYPLDSISAYALAMTWYAPEMPRPGCVWTHTLAIPAPTLSTIPSLVSLTNLFKRPARNLPKDEYTETLTFKGDSVHTNPPQWNLQPSAKAQLVTIFSAYYGSSSRFRPVVLVARDSDEFADAIFALWSQQWPALRRNFSFCTGSLSGRSIAGRAFDVQCSPPTLAKDVVREAAPDEGAEPILASYRDNLSLEELTSAIDDALLPNGGPFRQFLWTVADDSSSRAEFVSYAKVFDAMSTLADAAALVNLIAQVFPEPAAGRWLKAHLLSTGRAGTLTGNCTEQDILRALATTDKHPSFDAAALLDDQLVARLFSASLKPTRQLVGELFRSSLNPFGDQLLTELVSAMDAEDAQEIVGEQPQLLPALFRANPDLAASPQLWSRAGDRKRELLDSLFAQEIGSELVPRIVSALLDSGSDGFIRRAFERWGRNAVFAALDWTDNHGGAMSDICRGALTFQVSEVMSWVELDKRSTPALAAVAHVVAPYISRIAKHDSTVWLRTLRELQENGQEEEASYVRALLLALALCNAPPEPLGLVAESFEVIYRKAEKEQLRDNAWVILEPLVPELKWFKNWDKCERMRRALLLAFMRHSWPAWEIKQRIRNVEIRQQILDRAHKVGADHYFQNMNVKRIEVKFLRDDHTKDEAWYRVIVDGKDRFEVRISQTAKASGPPSPEERIREKVREWLVNGTLPAPGAVVSIGSELDPRYF
jgi:hypothetical protein